MGLTSRGGSFIGDGDGERRGVGFCDQARDAIWTGLIINQPI
jgi:hypothetical protein